MIDLSVLMPVYNASRYPDGWMERTINSVLSQPKINVELVIGDDGSTDDYLSTLTDPRIRMIRAGEQPSGGSAAADAAASIARGRYFIMVSCRSWYGKQALTALVNYLDAYQCIDIVWGNTIRYHADGLPPECKSAPLWNPRLFLRSFVTSFGYMYRREGWDAGARYECSVQMDDGTWMSIGDHFMLAQLIKLGYIGAPVPINALYYQYGIVPQAGDNLARYRGKLYEKFQKQLEEFEYAQISR